MNRRADNAQNTTEEFRQAAKSLGQEETRRLELRCD